MMGGEQTFAAGTKLRVGLSEAAIQVLTNAYAFSELLAPFLLCFAHYVRPATIVVAGLRAVVAKWDILTLN